MLTRADLRLLPAASCLWAAAALGVLTGTRGAVTGLAVTAVLILGTVLLLGRPALLRAVLSHLVLVALGSVILLPALQRWDAAQERLADAEGSGRTIELEILALSDAAHPRGGPSWAAGDWQLTARTIPRSAAEPASRPSTRRNRSSEAPSPPGTHGEGLPASVRVLVRAPASGGAAERCAAVRAGDRVHVRGRVRTDGTLVIVTVQRIEEIRPGPAWRTALREHARLTTADLPADEAALLRGMTTGDTAGLSEPAEDAMRRAGISHLVAVSGANIALVLGTVLAPLLLLGVPRRPRLMIAAAAGVAYVVLVGEEPSVLRAATMALPILAARFAGVRTRPVTALTVTVATWSIASPQTAASVGFALSAVATAAILVLAPPAARALTELSRERVPPPLALVITVPLAAQLACTPILLLLTPEVSAWAVPVNMLVAPLVGPGTVLGLVSLLLGPVAPGAAVIVAGWAAGATHLILLTARIAEDLPGARIPVPGGVPGAVAALGIIVALILAVAARKLRATRWAVTLVLVAVLAPPIAHHVPGLPGGLQDQWRITACAVGQGDAVLLRAPSPRAGPDTVVLVDTGPDPQALTACLNAADVQHIDLLVLTHPHADHTGGLAALTGPLVPREQWVCPLPEARGDAVPGASPAPAVRGTSTALPGLGVEVLWPIDVDGVEEVAARETSSSEQGAANDCSVVISATWGDGTRYVGLGDLEPAAQEALSRLQPGAADVVKVAHHGSRRQDPQLYRELQPRIAIVTVGEGNTFGHPAAPTLTLLQQIGAPTIRTDRDGTVEIEPLSRGADGEVARTRGVGPPR